jgi:hypothetical protein
LGGSGNSCATIAKNLFLIFVLVAITSALFDKIPESGVTNERVFMQRQTMSKALKYFHYLIVVLAPLLWMGCEEDGIPEVDNTIVVMPYNGPRLSAQDSWDYEREGGLINKWFAHFEGDSVVIERTGICGESCTEVYQLVLLARGSAMPSFDGCALLKNYSYPARRTVRDSLVSGEIEIQDWDLTGIVSGRVGGRWLSRDSIGFIFWADVMAENVELVISDYYGYEYPLIDSLGDSSIPESVREQYLEDAYRLSLRIMHHLGGEAAANLEIPKELSHTIYQALIHVYSSSDYSARDSVIDLYDIHTWPDPEMNRLIVTADSTTIWMQAWRQGFVSTGHTGIDSLMDMYGLEVVEYTRGSSKLSTHTATLLSHRRRNIASLGLLFQAIEGIDSASPDGPMGDGPDINVWPGENTWLVDYSLGWGDCLNGCINRHTWSFTVSFDGDVGQQSSSGPDIPSVLD